MKRMKSWILVLGGFAILGIGATWLYIQHQSKTVVHFGLRIPYAVTEKGASDSLMNGTAIVIKRDICADLIDMAKGDGWTVYDTLLYKDGGSVSYFLAKTKDDPAATVFCKWDLGGGGYKHVSIQFIHPKDIDTTVQRLNARPDREARRDYIQLQ